MKSSLTCTGGAFLSERVPKNGFGGPCGATFSDAEADADALDAPADDDAPFDDGLGVPP